MGRKLGLTLDQVVEAAVGVRSPSFCNHVEGLAGLRRHPTLHATSLLNASLLPAPTPEEGPQLAAALRQPANVVATVPEPMNIDPTTVIPLIRAVRASVHGFVDLELQGGFGPPDDIDASFATTINLVSEAIAAHAQTGVDS